MTKRPAPPRKTPSPRRLLPPSKPHQSLSAPTPTSRRPAADQPVDLNRRLTMKLTITLDLA